MAQYRAIFQNAYFKGSATAAVVTMGLAAGQAQAAANDVTDQDSWNKLVASDTEYTGTIKVDAKTINDNAAKFTLVLTGGDNKIEGKTTDPASITGSNATIKLADKASKLTIAAATGDNGTTATFKKLDVQSGTVSILQSTQKESKLVVDEVVLGAGKIELTGADTSGANLGKEGVTTYSLGEGSEIVLNANALVVGKSLSSNGGKLSFKDDNTWTIPNYVELK